VGIACKRPSNTAPKEIYEGAWLKLKRGEPKAALSDVDAALPRFPGDESEWHLKFSYLKAEILVQLRQNRDALALIRVPTPPPYANTDLAVWQKMTQGMAHCFLQEFGESEQLLADAEKLALSVDPAMLGEVFLRKGTLAFVRGDSADAIRAYSQALQSARERKDSFLEAAALGSLGLVATRQERYDEAIDWNQAALQLSRTVGAKASETKILGNLGWEFLELGDNDSALDHFKKAEEAARQAGRISSQVNWRLNIGNVYLHQRKFGEARDSYEKALTLANGLDDKAATVECYENLALVDLESNHLESAEHYRDAVAQLVHEHPDHFSALDLALVDGRIQGAKHEYQQAEQAFSKVKNDAGARTPMRWEAEARLAKTYGDERKFTLAEKEYREAIRTIATAKESLKSDELRLTFLTGAIEFYDDYVDFLVAHGKSDEALRVAELSRARTLAEGLPPTAQAATLPLGSAGVQQIARRLKASLFFYWVGHAHSYLWVITPGKTSCFVLPQASEIDPLVKSFRKSILEMRDAQDTGSSEGKQLYTTLVEPAKKLLPPGSRVIVLPSESLYGLNFETLIVPDPKPHFWIEDVTLTTASSLTLLASSATHTPPEEKSLFLVGDTEPPDPSFPPLPQAREEMKQIQKYFPKSQTKVLEKKQATPAAYLRSNPEKFTYVHFVTHGTASHTRPLESAVILSKEGDAYKLYARDIVPHRLNASLVTISACYGSGTRAYSGEGLVGLSWAFLRAGAHNVIGALWEVSAASTPQLMDSFYGELFQGKDPATALREAKLKLLHSRDADSVFKKPFYWAPFQLYAGS
jgi:CHAT domain-containing protein